MDSTGWLLVGTILLGLLVVQLQTWRRTSRLQQQLAVAERVAGERQTLLGSLVDVAPTATILMRASGSIVLANPAARELFFEGQDPTGQNLIELMRSAPAAFRTALLSEQDALFMVGSDGEDETYHLVKRELPWEGESMTLVLVRHLTRALRRQEVAVWKKLLRVISHELNNSLAPISSMAHTARQIAQTPEDFGLLDRVFATIEERVAHLRTFLDGYATLARLPAPRRALIAFEELIAPLRNAHPTLRVTAGRGTAWVDGAQLEQLTINLVKNAEEAGGHEVELLLQPVEGGCELSVRDRGPGMSDEVLRSALLPFYSTKPRGTGLGLALCREIVEAHDGKIRLANREGGGLEVTCFFPDAGAQPTTQARLTLRRD